MQSISIPNEVPMKAVVLPDSVYQSRLGNYFIGQTDVITFGEGYNCWGGLVNPADSSVNLFINVYTISNYSVYPVTVEGFMGSILPGMASVSPHYSAGNQTLIPPNEPKARIMNADTVIERPMGSSYTFVRRVEPLLTLTKHDFQGMYIIPPGSSFALYFLSPGDEQVFTRVAFGWWEA